MARRVRNLVGRHELVVVGYDGTQLSRPALLWAAAEARRREAVLRVVTVSEHQALLRRPAAELVRSWAQARHLGGEVAAAGAALAAAAAPGVEVEAVAQVGSGAAVLAGESRRAAVLVLGPEAFAEGGQLRPDPPVSAQVWAVLARRSRASVVLVREAAPEAGPGVPVVVGVDGSREASRAAELAAGFAVGSHAPLRIVCAWVAPPRRRGGPVVAAQGRAGTIRPREPVPTRSSRRRRNASEVCSRPCGSTRGSTRSSSRAVRNASLLTPARTPPSWSWGVAGTERSAAWCSGRSAPGR